MLTIETIMNSIDASTNGNKHQQSDDNDFQSVKFNDNADDDFGDFTDFQDNNKLGDDDFGDFTFFKSITNVNNNNSTYFNSGGDNSTTTTTINQTATLTPTIQTMTTTIVTPTTTFSANGFRRDAIETKQQPNYELFNEISADEFGDFTVFSTDNKCDKNNDKSNDDDAGDDEFGDFTFFQGNDKTKLGPLTNNHQMNDEDKDNHTDGDVNFFSTTIPKLVVDEENTGNNLEQNVIENDDEHGEDGDDFGDFGDFTDFTEAPMVKTDLKLITQLPPTSLSSTILPSSSSCIQSTETESGSSNCLTTNSPLTSIVSQSFPKDIQNTGNQIISNNLFPNTTSQSYKMWQSLINWEEAASLKLNWESSHTFQVFLRSLKIDSRNIQQIPGLRNISTPLIPSKLTILQPTPLLPSIVPLEPKISQQQSHQPKLTPDSMNKIQPPPSSSNQEQSASSIPEASFDWNSSGLTNPLEKDWLILL